MIDDSLSDVHKIKGGYCVRCDTVWCAPGICNCKPLCRCHLMDNSCEVHHKSDTDSVGTQKLEGDKIDKSKMSEADKLYWSKYTPSVFEVEVWNKAIDAAADKASEHKVGPYYFISNEIRKLKK